MKKTERYIGLMSGTSLDGVDAVVVNFEPHFQVLQTHFLPYPKTLKQAILALQHPTENELEATALISNRLAQLYAEAVNALLIKAQLNASQITAIGCHGQTIRHQPKFHDGIGFTLQIGNAALLAELTRITVISDFRSRDIAAGGQGAPLVPAFHEAVFASNTINRAIINIGGIANITYLPNRNFSDVNVSTDKELSKNSSNLIFGFDSGPGNMLIDSWTFQHLNVDYDKNGDWSSTGHVIDPLLLNMLKDDFFALPPPKSTGRDLFNDHWLANHLRANSFAPQDVARTLVALTARTICDALVAHCSATEEVYLCGGGAHNNLLVESLQSQLQDQISGNIQIDTTDAFGIGVDWVEAIAFAWLAKKCLHHETASLAQVTGAKGPRILGVITQA